MALPIEAVLPELQAVLQAATRAVLQAPPGAGKTTRVPLALLETPWLAGRRIVLLEPRRLAARAAAARMADTRGERVGDTVGYRVRMDTKVSARTRIEVVTEGVLTRMLQTDPSLEGVGLVIFDEFHERSLHADLGLAFSLEAQAALREDLRLLVMSATLDGARVAALLGDAPVVTSRGRSFPVETHYLKPSAGTQPGAQPGTQGGASSQALERLAARTVRRALGRAAGDVLVFLPGAAEIRRVERLLADAVAPEVRVLPLYGNLPRALQDEALAPSPPGRRKVVLATSIAETSLTIEGVRVVVDSGLMRVPRFSPRSGMTRLATVRVSKASADQRRGRAGRLGPGVCYRLWTAHAQGHLVPHGTPEILAADLADLALELAGWGVADPSALSWLDPPPAAAFAQARDLLTGLGALGPDGTITEHGRRMAGQGLHPRLAHLVLRGRDLGLGATACDVAALLSERDLFRSRGGGADADLRLRLEVLRDLRGRRRGRPSYEVDRGAARHVLQAADHLRRRLGVPPDDADLEACGLLLALAYPDRIAQQRPAGADARTAGLRYRLRNGRAAVLPGPQALANSAYLVAADLDGRHGEARIFLAAPVAREDLEAQFAESITREAVIAWDADARLVRARRQVRLGALVLQEAPLADPDPAALAEALLDGIGEEGLGLLPWTKEARRLQERLRFMHHHAGADAGWPDVRDEALLATRADWLLPHVYGMKRAEDLQRLDLVQLLTGLLTWPQRNELDAQAPSHVAVPSGSRIPVDYSTPEAPVLAVRLQELFGLTETPRIAGGRVPLTLHLLSPAHRPVQVTQDLASFWRDAYFDVKKDLKGRYPKHYWPDDPLEAEPTHRAKPRR